MENLSTKDNTFVPACFYCTKPPKEDTLSALRRLLATAQQYGMVGLVRYYLLSSLSTSLLGPALSLLELRESELLCLLQPDLLSSELLLCLLRPDLLSSELLLRLLRPDLLSSLGECERCGGDLERDLLLWFLETI